MFFLEVGWGGVLAADFVPPYRQLPHAREAMMARNRRAAMEFLPRRWPHHSGMVARRRPCVDAEGRR